MNAAIKLTGIQKRFGARAILEGVDLLVPRGKTEVGKLLTCNALVITGQPEDQSAAAGGKATFTLAFAGSSGIKQTPPTIQWNFDGKPLAEGKQEGGTQVTGTKTATLTTLHKESAGKYTATLTGTLDSWDLNAGSLAEGKSTTTATSEPATLTVIAR